MNLLLNIDCSVCSAYVSLVLYILVSDYERVNVQVEAVQVNRYFRLLRSSRVRDVQTEWAKWLRTRQVLLQWYCRNFDQQLISEMSENFCSICQTSMKCYIMLISLRGIFNSTAREREHASACTLYTVCSRDVQRSNRINACVTVCYVFRNIITSRDRGRYFDIEAPQSVNHAAQ